MWEVEALDSEACDISENSVDQRGKTQLLLHIYYSSGHGTTKNYPHRPVLKLFYGFQSSLRKLYQGRREVVHDRPDESNVDCPSYRDGDARRVVGQPPEWSKAGLQTIQQVPDERVSRTSTRKSLSNLDWRSKVAVLGAQGNGSPSNREVRQILRGTTGEYSALVRRDNNSTVRRNNRKV